jgi:hypothetical protein
LNLDTSRNFYHHMNREEILALKERILADYQFTAIDKQLRLLALFTHLNQEITHLDALLNTLADNWGDNEFLWRLYLEHWEKLVHIHHHYTEWLNGVTHNIQAYHVLYPVIRH